MEFKELTDLLNKSNIRILRRYWLACYRFVDQGDEEELAVAEVLEKEILRRMEVK